MTFSDDDQHQLMDILKRELEVDEEERIFKYQFIGERHIYSLYVTHTAGILL